MVETSQYAWKNIKVRALGRTFVGIRGVKYKKAAENEHLHGRGSKPIAIQPGNETFDGELVLLQSELQALTSALGVISLTNIRFDIVVTYKVDNASPIVTDVLKSVQVSEYEKGMQQGDKFMEITVPFLCLDIIENVA